MRIVMYMPSRNVYVAEDDVNLFTKASEIAGGLSAAVAEALSYSPSTISQQLAQLERDAGVPLLVPEGRRVRLTEHGAALAAHAARALEADEQIRAELEACSRASPPCGSPCCRQRRAPSCRRR